MISTCLRILLVETMLVLTITWGRRRFVVVVFDRVVRPCEPAMQLEADNSITKY